MLNRDEMARRIARTEGYKIKDVKQVLQTYEDTIVEAMENGEEIKQGKLFRIFLHKLPKKHAWDGLNKKRFIRPAKQVYKVKFLSKLENIEFPEDEEDENEDQ